jgi:hypothetical protein
MLPSDLFLLSFTFPKDSLGSEKLKQHEPWFAENAELLDQRKQVKLQ